MDNVLAFLTMIGMSEGTIQVAGSENGYNVIVGGKLFSSYADHPRKEVWIPRLVIFSSAAGRYQIEVKWFDAYKKLLGLPDFSPKSQDAIAVKMITECDAKNDIYEGNLFMAVTKCSSRWASLPGNDYGQREIRLKTLRAYYTGAGGTIAETNNV